MTDPRPEGTPEGPAPRPSGGFWQGFADALDTLGRALSHLWREGSKRQLAMRSRSGRTVFRLPLTVAALIALFLLWKAAPLLLLGIIVVLALRGSFVVLRPDAPQT